MYINFNEINVDSIETNSGIFIGQNMASGFSSHQKTISIFGTVRGNNAIKNNLSIIFDEDAIDMAISNTDQNKLKNMGAGGFAKNKKV